MTFKLFYLSNSLSNISISSSTVFFLILKYENLKGKFKRELDMNELKSHDLNKRNFEDIKVYLKNLKRKLLSIPTVAQS